ncbi:hypothetical protein HY061_02200 [Candidatus Azambacteria bacterium]|nr:hypothetical protein [Candidatus Azambacteria bacterium]
MKSKWFELKEEAIKLRENGLSIGKIEHRLGISRSTLSDWFKNIELTSIQKKRLLKDWHDGLVKARKKAIQWHNTQKEERIREAKNQALNILENIDLKKLDILELALAMLYLGEGAKKKVETSLGNSDPLILQFFIVALRKIYNIKTEKIKCDLYLRADQNPLKMRRFWAKQLGLPLKNFVRINLDKRTIGVKTYSYYKGVCSVRCGTVAIQRKLIFLANLFCERMISQ